MTTLTLLLLLAGTPQADAERLAQEGAQLARAGRLREAAAKLREARQADPSNAAIAYNLGQILEAAGDGPGAIAAYRDYLAAAPDAPDREEVQSLIFKLRDASLKLPPEALDAVARAEEYKKLGRSADAERELATAARAAPLWPTPWFMLANVQEGAGEPAKAIESLRRYLTLCDPSEAGPIRSRIAHLEIAADDQRKAEVARAAQAEQAARDAARAAEDARLRERAQAEAAERERAAAVARDREIAVDTARGYRSMGTVFIIAGAVAVGLSGLCMLLGVSNNGAIKGGGFSTPAEIEGAAKRGDTYNLLAGVAGGGGALLMGAGILLRVLNPDPVAVTIAPALNGRGIVVSGAF